MSRSGTAAPVYPLSTTNAVAMSEPQTANSVGRNHARVVMTRTIGGAASGRIHPAARCPGRAGALIDRSSAPAPGSDARQDDAQPLVLADDAVRDA